MSLSPVSASPLVPIYSTSSAGQWAHFSENRVFAPLEQQAFGIPFAAAGRVVVYGTLTIVSVLEEYWRGGSLAPLRAYFVQVAVASLLAPFSKLPEGLRPPLEAAPQEQEVVPQEQAAEELMLVPQEQEVVPQEQALVLQPDDSQIFPDELWLIIFRSLPLPDLIRCLQTCRQFRRMGLEVIRNRFFPKADLPWESQGTRWTCDPLPLVRHINSGYRGTPELWARIVTYLAQCQYPFKEEEWGRHVRLIVPPQVATGQGANKSEILFEILTHLKSLGFPMQDNVWGNVCDAMVRSIKGDLTVDFMRKVVFFLADEGWTFQRQKVSRHEFSLFERFFRDQARELENGITPSRSFEECLSFLRMLAKIGLRGKHSDGAQYHDVAVIVSFLLEKLGSQTESLSLPIFLEVISSLKKIGRSWTIFFNDDERAQAGMANLMEWAIDHADEFSSDQILELFSLEWLGGDAPHNQRVLSAFLTRLERIDQESRLALEEAFKAAGATRFYKELPPDLPFFRSFFARQKAEWDRLTAVELAALRPEILAAGIVLYDHVVTFCPSASETWPELFGQGSFTRLMGWDERLSFDQMSLCFNSIPTRDVRKHYSEAWIDLAVASISSDKLLSSESMYEFLYHVSNEACASRLIEPIKQQILRPKRAWTSDESKFCLKLMHLLSLHGCWDDAFGKLGPARFMPHIKSLNASLRFEWDIAFSIASRREATNPFEGVAYSEQSQMRRDLSTLRFLSKMSLFRWDGGDDLAAVSHQYLKSLDGNIRKYVKNDQLRPEMEHTLNMLGVPSQYYQKYYGLFSYLTQQQ